MATFRERFIIGAVAVVLSALVVGYAFGQAPGVPGTVELLGGLLGFILEFQILQILLVCAGIMIALLWYINPEQTPQRDRGR
jgi:uncharacterized membrane protein